MNNLRDLDLNLLVILDVLLAERHVSRTAARLEMSQPAVSHALKRLRHLFADPLLVRAGSQLRPTPFALEIGENLHEALAAIRKTMRRDDKFVPSTVRRTFKLAMSDYGAFIFLPGILSHLRRFAPNTDLIVVTGTREEQIERLISGELDLAIGVFPAVPPTVRTSRLFAEQFACLLDRHNRFCKGPFTLESYLNSPHLLVSVRGDPVGSRSRGHLLRLLARRPAHRVGERRQDHQALERGVGELRGDPDGPR